MTAIFNAIDTNWIAFIVAGGVVGGACSVVLWAVLRMAGRDG
jgi:hypothetical protein